MIKAGLCVAGAVVGLAVAGCGRLDDLIDDLVHRGGGQTGGDGGCGAPGTTADGGAAAACPFTGCAASTPPAGTDLKSVWIAASGQVWTAGEAGVVGRRSDAGVWCWCVQASATNLNAVWGSGDDDVWIVGDAGSVLRWNGAAFTPAPDVAPARRLAGVSGTSATDVWVVGDAGTVRHFDGSSWSALDASSAFTLSAVWTSDPGHVWVVGSNPTVDAPTGLRGSEAIALQRTASGWTKHIAFSQGFGGARLAAIDGISASDIWAVGTNQPAGAAAAFGGAAHFDGLEWTVPAAPDDFFIDALLTGVAAGTPDAPHGAWMVGGVRGLRTDGAGTWTKSDDPLAADCRPSTRAATRCSRSGQT